MNLKNLPKQTIGSHTVILDAPNRRVIVLPLYYAVPLEIARLGAGRDAWLRDVVVQCSDCKAPTRLGDTECDCLCPECLQKAEDEIADDNS